MDGIDIYRTRRDYFARCYWWSRDDKSKEIEEIVMERKPSGKFYAKEVSPLTNQKQVIGGAFQFSNDAITLKTEDNARRIKANDIVEYSGKYDLVMSVHVERIRKQSEFSKQVSNVIYIQLKG